MGFREEGPRGRGAAGGEPGGERHDVYVGSKKAKLSETVRRGGSPRAGAGGDRGTLEKGRRAAVPR